MQVPCKIYFEGNKRYNKDLLKKKELNDMVATQGWTLYLNWAEKKV